MMKLDKLLNDAIEKNASDIHFTVGTCPHFRINGKLVKGAADKLTVNDTAEFAKLILQDEFEEYEKKGEMDATYSIAGLARFRVNIYKQRNSDSLALRTVSYKVPSIKDLDLPSNVKELALKDKGIVIVSGPNSCGKSTTCASMINEINISRAKNIVTVENPIEFLHKHSRSVINQREVGRDIKNYESSIRSILREDPDVIFFSDMENRSTILAALAAAENGHLVISCMNTSGVCNTIERIVEYFSLSDREIIQARLASVLQGVIYQQLLSKADGEGRVAAFEIMVNNEMVQNLIKEGKINQIESIMQTGTRLGMQTMNMSLLELCKKNIISKDTALNNSNDSEMLDRMMLL
nr:PilT/PilU family type 4a pilus ATPase [Hathewaya proteolytica]